MNHIGDILLKSKINPSRHVSEQDQEIDIETAAVVNKLFATLRSIFPAFKHAWSNQKDFDLAKLEWIKTFKLAGLNDVNAIKIGLNKYRLLGKSFVPTAGEFIAMCKPTPEDFGLMSAERAYVRAYECSRNNSWSEVDDVIKHAWLQSDPFFMKNNDRRSTFDIFSRNYEISCRMKMSGEPLGVIVKAICQPEAVICKTKEIGSEHLLAIKNMIGIK